MKMVQGQKIIVKQLLNADNIYCNDKHKTNRKIGAIGILINWLPGLGGDAWFVLHDKDKSYAVYWVYELELYLEPDIMDYII